MSVLGGSQAKTGFKQDKYDELLEELRPLFPNGKLDKNAVKAYKLSNATRKNTFELFNLFTAVCHGHSHATDRSIIEDLGAKASQVIYNNGAAHVQQDHIRKDDEDLRSQDISAELSRKLFDRRIHHAIKGDSVYTLQANTERLVTSPASDPDLVTKLKAQRAKNNEQQSTDNESAAELNEEEEEQELSAEPVYERRTQHTVNNCVLPVTEGW
jgi:hypothetical protein